MSVCNVYELMILYAMERVMYYMINDEIFFENNWNKKKMQ